MIFSPVFSALIPAPGNRSRDLTLVVAAAALAGGCAEWFEAHPRSVARVEQQELTIQRLGQLMVLGQPLPLEEEVARELAEHWVDVSALAVRLASGDSLWSESFVRDAMWLNIRRLAIARWRNMVAAEGLTISATAVDSAYRAGEHRMVAHILRAVPDTASPEFREQQRATAQRIRDQLMAGMSWEEANQQNDDSLTRDANGSLGVTGRGTFVPRFENVAYELGPGDLSSVVETQAGYHVIFRPPLENVREPFEAFVRRALRARFDSTYHRSILDEYQVDVAEGAPEMLRTIAANVYDVPDAQQSIATYAEGTLTGERIAQYVRLLSPQTHNEMVDAPDDDLIGFTEGLVLEEILWQKADSAGLQPNDSTIALMVGNYRRDLSRLWQQMGLTPDSLATTSGDQTPNDRAAQLVDRYFEAAVSRRIPLQPLPGFLVAKLREGISWDVDPAGLRAAVDLARRLQAGTDATAEGESQ